METDFNKDILEKLNEKYNAIRQNTETHLEGLVWSKPITYWDYIQTDALLSLQVQRTVLPDEMVFIAYHQVSELYFKMILWEIEQICSKTSLTTQFFSERLTRISRYFDILTSSFNIMSDGMEIEQFMKFRKTLVPASGFQSAQYRLIEFASTDFINLIDLRFRNAINDSTPMDIALEHMYWQAAGKDYQTGERSYLLSAFTQRYGPEFLRAMDKYRTSNLWQRFTQLPTTSQKDPQLIAAMRHYDYTVNITWVMGHLNAAHKYIGSGPGLAEATGGSDWKRYMHPRYQKRVFFPALWSEEELQQWGENA